MGLAAETMNPNELLSSATAVGGTTGGTFTLFTASAWLMLISAAVTYVAGAATTATIQFQAVDQAGNILWRTPPSVAITASSTGVVAAGQGVPVNTSSPLAQTLPLPDNCCIPPQGKLQAIVGGTTLTGDTIASSSIISY